MLRGGVRETKEEVQVDASGWVGASSGQGGLGQANIHVVLLTATATDNLH